MEVNLLFMGPNLIWNVIMIFVGNCIGTPPQGFSTQTWAAVENIYYPAILAIGTFLFNFLFLINMCRQFTNIRQNITTEILIEAGIRVVLANIFLKLGLQFIRFFLNLASYCGITFLDSKVINLSSADLDVGTVLFYILFGIISLIVTAVCAFMIFLVVYTRYINLYLLVITAPLALSFIAGGSGLDQRTSAWVKTFFAKCFEIVFIALALSLAAKLTGTIDFGSLEDTGMSWIDGFGESLQNLAIILVTTAAVKGADGFLRRSLAL